MKTIIEPFRIKSVEPIKMTTRAQREALAAQFRAQPQPAFKGRPTKRDRREIERRGDSIIFRDAGGVKRSANHVITNTRQIFHTTSTDQYD